MRIRHIVYGACLVPAISLVANFNLCTGFAGPVLEYDSSKNICYQKSQSEQKKTGYEFTSDDTITIYDFDFSIERERIDSFRNVKHIRMAGDTENDEKYCGYTDVLRYFKNVTDITLTENIQTFNCGIAKYLPSLERFIVDGDNPSYCALNGILYSKDKKKLLKCPHKVKPDVEIYQGTKELGEWAFYNTNLTTIRLPEGLTAIHENAFGKTNLKSIDLPSTLTYIDEEAFTSTKLETIHVSKDNKNYSSYDDALYTKNLDYLICWPEEKKTENLIFPNNLYYLDCNKIKKFPEAKVIVIPKGLSSITGTGYNQLERIILGGKSKFVELYKGVLYSKDYKEIMLYPNKMKDTNITIHENVEILPMDLFLGENTTKTLTLPKNLKGFTGQRSRDYFLLQGFSNLEEIKLDPSNPNYKVKDGVLYDKKMTTLLWYPINLKRTSFTVPKTVTLIDNDQLVIQKNLEHLTIPKACKIYPCSEDSSEVLTGRECTKLCDISVEEENPYYCSEDGVLFSKNMMKLLCYPVNKQDTTYVIPDSVIVANFRGRNEHLKVLTIPKDMIYFEVEGKNVEEKKEDEPLGRFSALETIKVADGNPILYAKDGVVYTKYKDGTYEVVVYPKGKRDTSFEIPRRMIFDHNLSMFLHQPYLKTIYIKKNDKNYCIKDGKLHFLDPMFNDDDDIDFGRLELKYK